MMIRNLLIALSSFLIFSQSLFAATYYIREDGTGENKAAATSCSDASSAMSIATHNSETFLSGDIIRLCTEGGTYDSTTLIPPSDGSSENVITYQSDDTENPVTLYTDTPINITGCFGGSGSEDGDWAIQTNGRQCITIQYINVADCTGIDITDSDNITLQHIETSGTYWAISMTGGNNNLIDNVTVDTVCNGGIVLYGMTPGGSEPANCTVQNSSVNGSVLEDGFSIHRNNIGDFNAGSGNQFLNNTSYNNDEEGFDVTAGDGTILRGNTSYNNTGQGIIVWHYGDSGATDVWVDLHHSYDEKGIVVGSNVEGFKLSNSLIVTGANEPAVYLENATDAYSYLIYNNTLISNNTGVDPPVARLERDELTVKNNIIVSNNNGYLVVWGSGMTPDANSLIFSNNLYNSQGAANDEFRAGLAGTQYNFDEFNDFTNVSDTLYQDPSLDANYKPDDRTDPVVNVGTDLGSDYNTDLDGNSRPSGGIWDIGAYEYMWEKFMGITTCGGAVQ